MPNFPTLLLEGHRKFRNGTFLEQRDKYHTLAEEGQSPEVLVIGCSDSRVNPNEIFSLGAGDIFIVRNVANLVPPFEELGAYHGVSAALEFGVMHLKVKHVVVLGHTGCGGVKAMLDPATAFRDDMTFINNWISMMAEPRDAVLQEMKDECETAKMEALEQRCIQASLQNLRTFPFVRNQEAAGALQLHGAYFDVGPGLLHIHNQRTGGFEVAVS